jgi:hypothetical protein
MNHICNYVLLLLLLLLISYHGFPFPRYFFSWTSGAPHHSGFKIQIVALTLCTMSLVQLFYREYIEYFYPVGTWGSFSGGKAAGGREANH